MAALLLLLRVWVRLCPCLVCLRLRLFASALDGVFYILDASSGPPLSIWCTSSFTSSLKKKLFYFPVLFFYPKKIMCSVSFFTFSK